MCGFYYRFNNLRFRKTQTIVIVCLKRAVNCLLGSSEHLKCRLLKWLLDHPTNARLARRPPRPTRTTISIIVIIVNSIIIITIIVMTVTISIAIIMFIIIIITITIILIIIVMLRRGPGRPARGQNCVITYKLTLSMNRCCKRYQTRNLVKRV